MEENEDPKNCKALVWYRTQHERKFEEPEERRAAADGEGRRRKRGRKRREAEEGGEDEEGAVKKPGRKKKNRGDEGDEERKQKKQKKLKKQNEQGKRRPFQVVLDKEFSQLDPAQQANCVFACHSKRCVCNGQPKNDPGIPMRCVPATGGEALKRRIGACVRGVAFVHRGVRMYHSYWDTYAGDTMLLLAGISLRSQGQVKEGAERRFWQVASMFEARYQSWAACGAASADPEANTGDVLCLAEGLLAMKWMGVDIHSRPGLNSVWKGVKHALTDQVDVVDLFGFDPRDGMLPLTKKENCNNCTSPNEAGAFRCRYCGWILRFIQTRPKTPCQ